VRKTYEVLNRAVRHVGPSELDKTVSLGDARAIGPLDNVRIEHLASIGKQVHELVLIDLGGQVAHEDRATVEIVLAQELFVGIGA
jgi:hypothetical protein